MAKTKRFWLRSGPCPPLRKIKTDVTFYPSLRFAKNFFNTTGFAGALRSPRPRVAKTRARSAIRGHLRDGSCLVLLVSRRERFCATGGARRCCCCGVDCRRRFLLVSACMCSLTFCESRRTGRAAPPLGADVDVMKLPARRTSLGTGRQGGCCATPPPSCTPRGCRNGATSLRCPSGYSSLP